jgi:hypothetical protein
MSGRGLRKNNFNNKIDEKTKIARNRYLTYNFLNCPKHLCQIYLPEPVKIKYPDKKKNMGMSTKSDHCRRLSGR